MNAILGQHANLTATALPVFFSLLFTLGLWRKAGKTLRFFPACFFMLGPISVLTCLAFYLFTYSYAVAAAILTGSFVYTIQTYSLVLLGATMGYAGIRYMQASVKKCLEPGFQNRFYFIQLLPIVLFSVPLIPITVLACAPIFFCGISAAALPFVRKKEPVSGTVQDTKKGKQQARIIPLYRKTEAEIMGKLGDDNLLF